MAHLEAHDKSQGQASSFPPYYDEEEDGGEFEDEEDLYFFQGRARVVLGNRRFGPNGFMRGGRTFARAVNPPLDPIPASGGSAPSQHRAGPSSAHDMTTPPSKVKSSPPPRISNNPFKGKKAMSNARSNANKAANDAPLAASAPMGLQCIEPVFPTSSTEEALGPTSLATTIASSPSAWVQDDSGEKQLVTVPVFPSPADAPLDEEGGGLAGVKGGRRAQRAAKRAEVDGKVKIDTNPQTSISSSRGAKKGRPKIRLDDDEGYEY